MKFLAPEQMEKPRKRRLRKELRLGEFQGFGLNFELAYGRSALSHDDTLDHLIDLVEAQSWMFGGGDSPERVEISGYLCLVWVDSLDETDRESTRL